MRMSWGNSLRKSALASIATATMLAGTAGAALAQDASKTITIVLQTEPYSLDGCDTSILYNGQITLRNVLETMDDRDAKTGDLKPRLATSWEQVNDTTWRFHLRPGVKFHDGAEWNADAAAKSIARLMDQNLACEVRTKILGNLKLTTKVVDPMTIDITGDTPVPILPVQMAAVTFTSPNTDATKLVDKPVGTGPYVFDHWSAGQEVVIKRNDNYWGDKPVVEAARYVFRNESSVRASMVKLGEADLAPVIGVQDATDPALDKAYLNSETSFLRIDALVPPLNDVRVRLALNYGFDRYSMLGTMFPKESLHATQIVVPAISGHNPELDTRIRPYDPDKAKALLAEAKADGVPVDKEILLYARPQLYPNSPEVMEAILAMYQAIGLNVKLETIDEATNRKLASRPYAEGREPSLIESKHDNNQGDPVFSAVYKYGCQGGQSPMCDAEVDKMIADASATPAGPERVKKWQTLFAHLYDDIVPEVWMYHMIAFASIGPRINFEPTLTTNSELDLPSITFK